MESSSTLPHEVLRDLEDKLDRIAELRDAEIERVRQKYAERITGLTSTISLYRELVGGDLLPPVIPVSPTPSGESEERDPTFTLATEETPDFGLTGNPEPDQEPEHKRKRLPRGFIRERLDLFAASVDHFFHIEEALDDMNDAIREAYPDQPHLEASRNSVGHNLLQMWQEGTLVRAVYDGHSHFYFHGRPDLVKRTQFGPAYIDESAEPHPSFLEGVSDPVPEFPDPPTP